jgi:glutamate-1-semialdehyde 2,1-aminomutase
VNHPDPTGEPTSPVPFPLDYEEDVDGPVWRSELDPFLPPRLFDIHSHIFLAEHRPPSRGESADPSQPTVCEAFPLENYCRSLAGLFPGRELRALLFGTVDAEADTDAINEYVRRSARSAGFEALLVVRPGRSPAELEEEVRRGKFLGFKPYWTFVRGKRPEEITLADMMDQPIRAVADRLGLLLMVHIPRPGRLADAANVAGLEALCRECPRAKVILAHFGRAYFPEALSDLGPLPRLENLYVDCSMVQDAEVLEAAFRRFDLSRILFGLDMPVAQEKGKVLGINGQRHFFTKRVHPWSIHNSTKSYRIRCTFMAYEMVRALKKAMGRVGLGPEAAEKVFYDNAASVVQAVKEDLR